MLRYYEILKEIKKESEARFKELIKGLGDKEVCVVLFGSKAKNNDNLLSDFDLLIIVRKKGDVISKVSIDLPADIFCYTVEDCLKEIVRKNSIILDAFTQGKLIIDNIGVFEFLKGRVRDEIRKNNLIRTKLGWMKNHLVPLL